MVRSASSAPAAKAAPSYDYSGLLSAPILIVVSLVVSSNLIRPALRLADDPDNWLVVRVPWLLRMRAAGSGLWVALAIYILSIFAIGLTAAGSSQADQIYIVRLQATQNQWIAKLMLASTITVIVAVFFSLSVLVAAKIRFLRHATDRTDLRSPEEIADRLTNNPKVVDDE